MKKLLVMVIALSIAACAGESSSSQPGQTEKAAAALPAGMSRVDPTQVCMVNNQFMGKPQIPIAVEGRTYYGCCNMCKDRLGNDPSSRVAQDPVTGENVDKATAVIIQDPSGRVLYFVNEATLSRFRG